MVSARVTSQRLFLFTPCSFSLSIKDKIKYAQFLHDASEVKYNEQGDDMVLTLPAGKPGIEMPVIELMLK